MRVDLPQSGLHPAVLVNEVVDEVPGVLVLEGSLVHASLVEKLLQIGINILQIKSMIRIPADVANVLEVGRKPDVFFLNLPLRSFLGPEIVSNRVGQAGILRGNSFGNNPIGNSLRADTVSHVLSPGCLPLLPSLFPLHQLGLNSPLEDLSLGLVSKVEANLGIVPLKRMEVRPGSFVPANNKRQLQTTFYHCK